MSNAKANDPQPGNGSGALIFVVDDEPMLLELACAILEPLGYRLQTFRDPELALEKFTSIRPRPNLLITDYAMHSMNGMQLIESFRKLEPRQKILLVSGTVGEDIYEGARFQPDQFLAKPYQSQQLIGAVEKLLAAK